MKKLLLCFLVCGFLSSTSNVQADSAKKQLPLEELEKLQVLSNSIDETTDLSNKLESMVKENEFECYKAIGNPTFCECIRNEIPVGITFVQYVFITAKTKADLNYSKLTGDRKALVDGAYKAREKCVNGS